MLAVNDSQDRLTAAATTHKSSVSQIKQEYVKRIKHDEMQYLDLIQYILDYGAKKEDRTGTGTISVFGTQMRFSLRNNVFPLLTTKRVFWRGVAEELLWFVSGCTNAKELSNKGIRIWDANGSREFLDKQGLHEREVGDLGPVYGFQWRHFGAKYVDMHTNYDSQGVDQLANVIDKIKNNPDDRRIIMTAWNPVGINADFMQQINEKSILFFQGLGVPFNIASYSLLTYMIAHVCGLKPGDFVHTLGDAHVYLNHIDALKKQLEREPRPFPTLKIVGDVQDIDSFKFENFELTGYNPHPTIKMKMAV
ncbi:PREDICTED: thymidylate synthase-like [Acropora digitifera]|uniref:thymidylate synthase-like n=1 Tax=Acropora digitifera TaxID=70779 RepID=UPI00077A169E|nr:PREDICTED: thymidylate synthase-like [Acropora digitifera]